MVISKGNLPQVGPECVKTQKLLNASEFLTFNNS